MPTKSALIAAGALIFVNWWIIPSAQHRQIRLDRQYKVLTDVATTNANFYQNTWNVYFGKTTGEPLEARQEYRKRLQETSVDAERIRVELLLLFRDQSISEEWDQSIGAYHEAYYPLGQGEQPVSQPEFEKTLARARPHLKSLVDKIQKEIRY